MFNAYLVLLVFSLEALSLTFLFSVFVLLIRFFYISVLEGADSPCLLSFFFAQET